MTEIDWPSLRVEDWTDTRETLHRWTVRTAPDPDATLLGFLQTTYDAAADLGAWDREMLEYVPVEGARPA